MSKQKGTRKGFVWAAVAAALLSIIFVVGRWWPNEPPKPVMQRAAAYINKQDWRSLGAMIHPQEVQLSGWTPEKFDAVVRVLGFSRSDWIESTDSEVVASLEGRPEIRIESGKYKLSLRAVPNGRGWSFAAGSFLVRASEVTHGREAGLRFLGEALRSNGIEIIADYQRRLFARSEDLANSANPADEAWQPIHSVWQTTILDNAPKQ